MKSLIIVLVLCTSIFGQFPIENTKICIENNSDNATAREWVHQIKEAVENWHRQEVVPNDHLYEIKLIFTTRKFDKYIIITNMVVTVPLRIGTVTHDVYYDSCMRLIPGMPNNGATYNMVAKIMEYVQEIFPSRFSQGKS